MTTKPTKQWTLGAGGVRNPSMHQIMEMFNQGGFMIRKSGHSTYDDHDPGDEHRDPMLTTTECEPREGPIWERWITNSTPPPSDPPTHWIVISSGSSK